MYDRTCIENGARAPANLLTEQGGGPIGRMRPRRQRNGLSRSEREYPGIEYWRSGQMKSTLRCAPGDLALVLRSPDAGKLVTCLALADESERTAVNIDGNNGPVWRIDRCCMWNNWDEDGIPLPYAPDAALMPIHPRSDLLDTEPMLDLSAMDRMYQATESGELADILTQIARRTPK